MDSLWNVIGLLLFLLTIAGYWKVFEKAGEKGWKVLIPIYNAFIFLRITGKPWWWLLLMFIPIVNIVVTVIALRELARRFGQGVGFTVGLFFLPMIFIPILGFGDAIYASPNAPAPITPAPTV